MKKNKQLDPKVIRVDDLVVVRNDRFGRTSLRRLRTMSEPYKPIG